MLVEKASSGNDSFDTRCCSLPLIAPENSDEFHLLAKTLNTASDKKSNINKFTNSFCNRDITKIMNNINFKASTYAEHSHKKTHLKRISTNICDINNNISVHLNNKNNKNRHKRSKPNIIGGRMNTLSSICNTMKISVQSLNGDIQSDGETNEAGNSKRCLALLESTNYNGDLFVVEDATSNNASSSAETNETLIASLQANVDQGSATSKDKATEEKTKGSRSKVLVETRWKRERGIERVRTAVVKSRVDENESVKSLQTHEQEVEAHDSAPSRNRLEESEEVEVEDNILLGVSGRRKEFRENRGAETLDMNLLKVDAWESALCSENFVKRRASQTEMEERRRAKGSLFGGVRPSRASVQASSCLAALLLLGLFGTASCHIREDGYGPHMDVKQFPPTTPTPPPPMFDPTHSRDVTALAGKNAILNCRVHNINDKEVSWIRHRDIHLLTVGRYTYTSDQRFRGLHEEESDDWILKINYVQTRDSGIYECQVSTTPPKSHFIKLNVVEPLTRVLGGPDMYINKGSTINLTCVVDYSPEPPDFIYWNHNDKIISYDSERGGVTVIIEKGDVTTSSLLIQKAQAGDTGTYVCNPSNASPTSISVHVLNGEHPAAMQHGGQGTYTSSSIRNIISMLTLVAIIHRIIQ